jgi:hypothetical protein
MNDNGIQRPPNIMAPFMVFGIVEGCGVILVRLLPLFGQFDHHAHLALLRGTWVASSVAGLIYTAVGMRHMAKGSFVDRLMFAIFILIFVLLGALTFYIF